RAVFRNSRTQARVENPVIRQSPYGKTVANENHRRASDPDVVPAARADGHAVLQRAADDPEARRDVDSRADGFGFGRICARAGARAGGGGDSGHDSPVSRWSRSVEMGAVQTRRGSGDAKDVSRGRSRADRSGGQV